MRDPLHGSSNRSQDDGGASGKSSLRHMSEVTAIASNAMITAIAINL